MSPPGVEAKTAVELFDLIHSVDSVGLAEDLNKYASKKGKIQRILVQVKLSDEEAKHGIQEKDLAELLKNIAELKNLQFEGLMTIPPFFSNSEIVRPYFSALKKLSDSIRKESINNVNMRELSMGMTSDYNIAIKEGSTIVRIGTLIFGERNYY